MRLYDTPRAPNPRRVRWFMAEKGIADIEIVSVNLMQGEHRRPEYVAKAGVAVAPILELDDGACLTESVAICRYLESLYPEPNLMGRGAEETAVIEMWTRRAELTAANPYMLAVRHTHPALAALEEQDRAIGDWNLGYADRSLALFDQRLAGREWIAADRLTIADIVLFCGMDFARGMLKHAFPERYGNVRRWFEAMAARPAASVR